MRDVYREFKMKRISKEEGESRRRSVFKMRQEAIDRAEWENRKNRRFAQWWADIESAGTAYCKNRSVNTADDFFKAVYGVYPKAKQTEERND